jgi:hypothetical protein
LMPSASATEEPPYFCTTRPTGVLQTTVIGGQGDGAGDPAHSTERRVTWRPCLHRGTAGRRSPQAWRRWFSPLRSRPAPARTTPPHAVRPRLPRRRAPPRPRPRRSCPGWPRRASRRCSPGPTRWTASTPNRRTRR